MYNLGFKEADEQEIKLPAFTGSQRKEGNSRKTYTSASLTTLKPLTVWITTNCAKFLKEVNTRQPYLPPDGDWCTLTFGFVNWHVVLPGHSVLSHLTPTTNL